MPEPTRNATGCGLSFTIMRNKTTTESLLSGLASFFIIMTEGLMKVKIYFIAVLTCKLKYYLKKYLLFK